jgi:HAE1 family hydrophobic/amphiphilic exporter-1
LSESEHSTQQAFNEALQKSLGEDGRLDSLDIDPSYLTLEVERLILKKYGLTKDKLPDGLTRPSTNEKVIGEDSKRFLKKFNGDRILNVTSDITEDANAQIITNSISQKYEAGELELPSGITLSFGGEAEEVQESFTDLFLSMIIGILLIFGLLVWQFSSYKVPFIMLATIPLAFIGVFGGLAITFQPLSFPAFIGVVALAGIVVNNAIILIDRINLNKEEGTDHELAIREAAKSRLQPILLTTLTTVGGMIPLLFADPTWAPLAYAVIFGLLFSTILTLVVVPLLYQRYGR